MKLPKNALVAVVDGTKLELFRNTGDEGAPTLTHQSAAKVDDSNKGSGGRHASSSANPADHQQDEDGFAAGVAALLNTQALDGRIDHLLVVAAPRTLGELRKHFHKALTEKLVGELAKDLTGADAQTIEKAVAAA